MKCGLGIRPIRSDLTVRKNDPVKYQPTIRSESILMGFASVLLFASAASADAGVPMIALIAPVYLVAFIPIVLIETAILKKGLKIECRQSLFATTISNAVSTVVGVPITWIGLVLLEFSVGETLHGMIDNSVPAGLKMPLNMILSAPWLGSNASMTAVSFAMSLLLVIFFFVSWWSEFWAIRIWLRIQDRLERNILKKVIRNANIASYVLLLALSWLLPILEFLHHQPLSRGS